jgi:hypothetical protein
MAIVFIVKRHTVYQDYHSPSIDKIIYSLAILRTLIVPLSIFASFMFVSSLTLVSVLHSYSALTAFEAINNIRN